MSYSIDKSEIITYTPDEIRGFACYIHEWIDCLHFIRPPSEFLAHPESYLAVVREVFLWEGWDGDGEIGLLWLPPFVFSSREAISTEGLVLWHVKQENDGISWLLSPIELPFWQEFTPSAGRPS